MRINHCIKNLTTILTSETGSRCHRYSNMDSPFRWGLKYNEKSCMIAVPTDKGGGYCLVERQDLCELITAKLDPRKYPEVEYVNLYNIQNQLLRHSKEIGDAFSDEKMTDWITGWMLIWKFFKDLEIFPEIWKSSFRGLTS